MIDEKLAFKKHVDYIDGRALSALNGLSHILKYMNSESALSICNAIIITIITTSYPVWCTNTDIKQLEKVYRQIMVRCTKAFSSTSTACLEAFTHTLPINLKLTETLLNEWSRLLRTEDAFPLKALVSTLQSDQGFLQRNPHTFVSLSFQHQQDLNITLSNLEPLPKDSMDRILHFKKPIIHPMPKIGKPKRDWSPHDNETAKKHTHDALNNIGDEHVAFTDGSALGNPGPCGAAAIIIESGKEPTKLHQPVAQRGSSYLGELKGVELALTHFLSLATKKQIHIFCDCLSAIDSMATARIQQTYQPTIDRIQTLIRAHSRDSINVNLHWTPGHIDLKENEMANKKAKLAAREACTLPPNHAQLTIKNAKSIIKGALRNRWQRQWDRTQYGTLIHTCYPKVNTTRYKSVIRPTAESQLLRLLSQGGKALVGTGIWGQN